MFSIFCIIIFAHWANSFLMVVVLHSEPPLFVRVLLLSSILLAVEFGKELNGISRQITKSGFELFQRSQIKVPPAVSA